MTANRARRGLHDSCAGPRRDRARSDDMGDDDTRATGQLLDVHQVAEAWAVSEGTVRRWAREGRVPATRTPGGGGYRFTAAALPARGRAA